MRERSPCPSWGRKPRLGPPKASPRNALFYGRQTRRYGEQMTTQHNRIISPKADGIDQDGRPAARDVLSRSGLGT